MPPKSVKGKDDKKKDPNAKRNKAAIPIQCFARKILAKAKIKRVARKTWMRVFDPAFKMHFWFNKNTGKSIWSIPRYVDKFTPEDEAATRKIARLVRGFLGRRRARAEVYRQYTRYFDANVGKHYWVKHATGMTFWKASEWLVKQNVSGQVTSDKLVTR
jgi:hypothetical protein